VIHQSRCTHPVSSHEMGEVFNRDPDGMFSGLLVIVTTDTGSKYEITLVGPTVTAMLDDEPLLVRKVSYKRFTPDGKERNIPLRYIGFTGTDSPSLVILPSLNVETEHTTMGAPVSSPLKSMLVSLHDPQENRAA
jgi:hypothetical protein